MPIPKIWDSLSGTVFTTTTNNRESEKDCDFKNKEVVQKKKRV
jgi:hypothetical protein